MSKEANEKPTTITAASICFLAFGLIRPIAVLSVIIIDLARLSSEVPILANSSGANIGLAFSVMAFFSLFVAGLDMGVGYGLLRMKRRAAILGMLASLVGAVMDSTFAEIFLLRPRLEASYVQMNVLSFVFSSLSVTSFWIDLMLFVALAISWKSFQNQMG